MTAESFSDNLGKLAEKENSVSHDIPGVVATDKERDTAEIGE